MYCNQCGLDLPDNYKFCPKCGAEITLESKPVEGNKEKSSKKEIHQPQKPKKKISTKKVIGIGIGVFFAFIIIVGQIALYFSDNENIDLTESKKNISNQSSEETTRSNTSNHILDLPYSWTESNFKYTLVSLGDGSPESNFDETVKYGVQIDCQNLLKSNNGGSFQAINDIKLKTDIGYIWDLKFSYGLNACRDKFDPEELKSDGRAYFEIGKNEKPDVLLVSTYTGEQLTFNVSK